MTTMHAVSPSKRLFFCSGPPKSGTTFLQRLLNLHPEIHCSEEQNFIRLAQLLSNALGQYDNWAADLDRRTGGQGEPFFKQDATNEVLRAAMLAGLQERAAGKPIIGAKDNAMRRYVPRFGRMFPEARFIMILRNPLDRAVSGWHHSLRLAEKENNPKHREHVMQFGGFAGYVYDVAQRFTDDVKLVRSTRLPPERQLVLRYENLVRDTAGELARVLRFLEADHDPALIASLVAEADFDRMRERAADPGFFRQAALNGGGEEIDAPIRVKVAQIAAEGLFWLGYRIGPGGFSVLDKRPQGR